MKKRQLLPEWHPQSAIQLTWPNETTDWAENMEEVVDCYLQIANEILLRQKLIVVCAEKETVIPHFRSGQLEKIEFYEMPVNDTWARDHAPLTALEEGEPVLLDFKFNGWGNKFDWELDNKISKNLYDQKILGGKCKYADYTGFVLEGGAIDYDGNGTILTTRSCLLAPSRNPRYSKKRLENFLKETFGILQIRWLNYGWLAGDDTDGHIDTLARFANESTIIYTKCYDESDIHFKELRTMEKSLAKLRNVNGQKYNLVPIPLPTPVYWQSDRLPATYANFLIINGAVLLPVYNVAEDQQAITILKDVFKDHEIIPVNCVPLIKQHGSLHCITMQYPIECDGKNDKSRTDTTT